MFTSKKNTILVLIGLILLSYIFFFQKNTTALEKQIPPTNGLGKRSEIFCDASVSAFLSAGTNKVTEEKHGITAQIENGTDEIVLRISDTKLQLLTKASFEGGSLDTTDYEIARNDDEHLFANNIYNNNAGISTIMINKSSGLGTWNRNELSSFFTNNPDIQAYYLVCR